MFSNYGISFILIRRKSDGNKSEPELETASKKSQTGGVVCVSHLTFAQKYHFVNCLFFI
jgi:hypothetical protein